MKKWSFMKAMMAIFVMGIFLPITVSAQNFAFTIEPSALTLVPGQSASFVILLSPLNGFTNPVTFSVPSLPSGVTATFAPATLTPPGTTLLTLQANTNAANGPFTLNVTAAGGGVTNTTSSSVSVSFGLLPICTGAFQGIVTDTTTGLPVPYATVSANESFFVSANSNGQFSITNLPLASSENLPKFYSLVASRSNYFSSFTNAYAVCDATNIVNIQILLQQEGSLSGAVTSTEGGPVTNAPITAIYESFFSTTTSANGFYQFPSLGLANNNSPAEYLITLQPVGFWEIRTNVLIQANSNSVLNLVALPICYATVTGSVIYSDSGLPATNLSVDLNTTGSFFGVTDSHGNYTITNVTLGNNNTPINAGVDTSTPGYYFGYTNVMLTNCGQVAVAPVLRLTPIPVLQNNYGNVTGHIYDWQTDLPITNAFVSIIGRAGAQADTNGAYTLSNIFIGTGAETNSLFTEQAGAEGYFETASNVVVASGETTVQDLRLLRIGYGAVEGTVVNSATGLPVPAVTVSVPGDPITGSDGHYMSAPIPLAFPNTPTFIGFSAYKPGYWSTFTNTTITNNVTNVVNIDLIQVCTGATIVGNVVNALTQQPITNATISVSSQFAQAQTDTNGNFILTNITVGNDNSPIQTTLTANAPGFNPQTKAVTIFCNAVISTEFGAPETEFGTIDGFVTNVLTGEPLTNVFIGSSFGGATTTDTNGFYMLNQAPLGALGSSRTWTVTAIPTGFPPQTKSVVVSSNVVSQLDFGFGQAPTALVVSAIGAPNPVIVGSNLLYTVTLTNSVADAANVLLTDTLPPGVTFLSASLTNNAGSAFTGPILTNGMVTTMATNFSSNSMVALLITVSPTVAGELTNVATVTSDTPDLDPTGTNHFATVTNLAIIPAPPPMFADVGVSISAAPNPVLASNQLTYTLVVTNLGPASALGVVLTDSLPADVTFGGATVSQGTFAVNGNEVDWNIGALSNRSVSATVIVLPLLSGQITNTATVSITPGTPSETDTNLGNNSASVVTTVTELTLTNVSIQAGPIIFNPQTGLYQQTVQVNNLGSVTAAAVRLAVLDLPAGVTLYNARGSTNGGPYVEYDQPVTAGGNVVFLLEYYTATRQAFVSTNFVSTVVAAVQVPTPAGTLMHLDTAPFLSEGQLTIEFVSIPGRAYVVQYSADMETWQTATPPIVAKNTRTQWIDSGPPQTQSPPGGLGQRFYRIVETN